MRYIGAIAAIMVATVFAGPFSGEDPAYAAFHCMRIHAVKAGFAGDPNIQYVELRMDIGGQSFLTGHTIQFYDGANVLKATFTFPAGVSNAATGDSILVATSEFAPPLASGGVPDFTFSLANTVGANGGDPLHPVQSPNGRVVFAPSSANCASTVPADSLAYGSATPHYGTAAVALPGASDPNALRLKVLTVNPTNNSTEYELQPVSGTSFNVAVGNLATDLATPRNNGRTVIRLAASSVGGVADEPLRESRGPEVAEPVDEAGTSRFAYAGAAIAVLAVAMGSVVVWRRRSSGR